MCMCVYTHIYITSMISAVSFRNINSVLISFIPDAEVVTVVLVIFENWNNINVLIKISKVNQEIKVKVNQAT